MAAVGRQVLFDKPYESDAPIHYAPARGRSMQGNWALPVFTSGRIGAFSCHNSWPGIGKRCLEATNGPGRSGIANPYLFTSRRFDDETGLYYYRNRYYAWHLGRFVNRDPIGYVDGFNVYVAYFIPNKLDPTGFGHIPFPVEEPVFDPSVDPTPEPWIIIGPQPPSLPNPPSVPITLPPPGAFQKYDDELRARELNAYVERFESLSEEEKDICLARNDPRYVNLGDYPSPSSGELAADLLITVVGMKCLKTSSKCIKNLKREIRYKRLNKARGKIKYCKDCPNFVYVPPPPNAPWGAMDSVCELIEYTPIAPCVCVYWCKSNWRQDFYFPMPWKSK